MHKNHNSCLYIFQNIPLGTLVNAIVCPFCNLKNVQDIWMKLHTVEDDASCARTITLPCIFFELLPFDHLQCHLCRSVR